MRYFQLTAIFFILFATVAQAHDTWLQTNTNLVRTGDACHVDLLLGNHGNNHRDFKIAGKASLKHCTLEVLTPTGNRYDLADRLVDTGYTPTEGFWTARFVAAEPGLYLFAHKLDQVMSYAPVRAIKSAKTFFVANESLDRVSANPPGHDRVLGHDLEIVPTTNPVMPMGPEVPISVCLYFKGKPLVGSTVSFIPRGIPLNTDFDDRFERKTNDQGHASFTPTTGNHILVVAHHEDPNAKGEGYDKTKYSATLTVFVPESCTCCVD